MNFSDEPGYVAQTYILPTASDEQRAVVEAVASHNVIVDSVAGSGKTTTVLHIAQTYPDKRILLLTYNAKLRLETRDKSELLGINNIEVHTYHSFGVKYISGNCHTDTGIIKFVDEYFAKPNPEPNPRFDHYDLIIVDECQDMTLLYFKLVKSVIIRTVAWIVDQNKTLVETTSSGLCIIGDKYQSIYGYAGADSRFITCADRIYNRGNWKRLTLSTSYRITNQMAVFVNAVLGCERVKAVKNGPLVRYTTYSAFKPTAVLKDVQELLKKYAPSDIFILAPSVRPKNAKNPIKILSNQISESGIKVYMPMDDDSKLDEQVIAGKLVFSSFHQAKGLERKAVIIMGFDESYFVYYNRSDPKNVCNNVLYVAMTRASECLYVYQANHMPPFKFVNIKTIKLITDFRGKVNKGITLDDSKITTYGVTELTRHISTVAMKQLEDLLVVRCLRAKEKSINLPIKTSQIDGFGDSHYEEVSDINGTAIPAYYEYRKYGWVTIFGGDIGTDITIPQLLEDTNKYLAKRDSIIFKVNQIKKYDWLTDDALTQAYNRAAAELDPCTNLDFEKPVKIDCMGVAVSGRIDAFCDERIIEFKAVAEIKTEHLIQVALYGYMWEMETLKEGYSMQKPCHLFNVRTNELLEVSCINPARLLQILICKKVHQQQKISTSQFLRNIGIDVQVEVECEECGRNAK